MLTTFEDERKVYQAICGGAAGYLTKRSPLARVAEAVRDVHAGGTVIDPALARRFWNSSAARRGIPANPYGLTAEEVEVLALVGRGPDEPRGGARRRAYPARGQGRPGAHLPQAGSEQQGRRGREGGRRGAVQL